MIHSMTAIALREDETPWGTLSWELRSVNHRYLELSPRMPEALRSLEPEIRARIGQRLQRGKVDVNLRFQPKELGAENGELDGALLARLIELTVQVADAADSIEPLRVIDVLRWPGILKNPAIDYEALGERVMALLDQALDDLATMRHNEGTRLVALLQQRLQAMQAIVLEVRGVLPEVVGHFRARLEARLQEVQQQVDPARLEQEIVIFAQKIDVAEELDRLEAHIAAITEVLQGSGSIGRRLDFLMQELNREANTLASKAADVRLTSAAVELKVLIEQMREQVQNIE